MASFIFNDHQAQVKKRIPVQKLSGRTARFQQRLWDLPCDGALLIQRCDLLYFSGATHQVHLVVIPEGLERLRRYGNEVVGC